MKNDIFQKLIYQLVSKLLVLPIYKFVFKGHLIGRENIPKKGSFIMVANHGSLLDPPLLGHALDRHISFMAKAEHAAEPISSRCMLVLVLFKGTITSKNCWINVYSGQGQAWTVSAGTGNWRPLLAL